MDAASHLLLEIAGCPEIGDAHQDSGHPCHAVVAFQRLRFGDKHVWQPPTPWVGRIERAPILFIGSNPNIAGTEYYPSQDWADEQLIEFFDCAFNDVQIRDGKHARQADESWGPWVRTWASAKKRAEELLQRQAVPGDDYAMTEIVHCRSQNETGVDAARSRCADSYLDRTLGLSAAQVIVAFGAHTASWLRGRWRLDTGRLVSEIEFAGKMRLVAFLPHPTGRARSKTFSGVMPEHLDRLRQALRA